MRVYFIGCVLLVSCWLMPLSLLAQEEGRLTDALPKDTTRSTRIREIKEVFAHVGRLMEKEGSAKRDSLQGVVDRLFPGFDLDSPDVELLPQEMMVELIEDYFKVYNVVRMNVNKYSYVLFNVKSEKVRNAYVLPFVRSAFEQGGYGKELAEVCENVRWCSKTPETVKEVEALVEQYRPLRAGAAAPEFVLENRKGESVKLSDFKGKHVFMGIFSSEMNENEAISRFTALPDEYNNTDRFVYFCVCLGKADARDGWRKQVADKTGKVDFLFCDVERCSFVRDYCISRVPRYVFVNKDGALRDAWYVAPGCLSFLINLGIRLLRICLIC